jgi:transcription initiation factor IIE alpha subunit
MPTIERLYSGIFECPECDSEYEVDRATADDLFCEECGGDLESGDAEFEIEGDEEDEAA